MFFVHDVFLLNLTEVGLFFTSLSKVLSVPGLLEEGPRVSFRKALVSEDPNDVLVVNA